MTPKELREMAENKALDIGTARDALEDAAERIEMLEADCASLKQRAWRAESRADEKWGLRKELAEALGVSDKCDDEALRAGLAAIRRLENERDVALARLDHYEERNLEESEACPVCGGTKRERGVKPYKSYPNFCYACEGTGKRTPPTGGRLDGVVGSLNQEDGK